MTSGHAGNYFSEEKGCFLRNLTFCRPFEITAFFNAKCEGMKERIERSDKLE